MRKLLPFVAITLVATSAALAQSMPKPVNATDLQWGPAPPVLPKGAQLAVISGNPSDPGVFVVRLKLPKGYKFPAHNHPITEYVTVLSGDFHVGMGDKLDEQKAIELKTGGFAVAPAKMNHFGWASSPTIIQIEGEGPFQITYVNPADDPSTHTQ